MLSGFEMNHRVCVLQNKVSRLALRHGQWSIWYFSHHPPSSPLGASLQWNEAGNCTKRTSNRALTAWSMFLHQLSLKATHMTAPDCLTAVHHQPLSKSHDPQFLLSARHWPISGGHTRMWAGPHNSFLRTDYFILFYSIIVNYSRYMFCIMFSIMNLKNKYIFVFILQTFMNN